MSVNQELMTINQMIIQNSTQKILTSTLRYVSSIPTIAMLAEDLKMTHVGVWKALKRLESENIVILKPIGGKKNSIYSIYINWENPLVEKTLNLALEHEATYQRRWLVNFDDLKNSVDFLILYGSILVSQQKANDIDIIGVVSKKGGFNEINSKIEKIQKTQLKKIHAINFSPEEFREEIKKPNIAFIDALKNGVILFGQDKFIKFIRELKI